MAFGINVNQFNPFHDDFDGKKSLLALGTLGTSVAAEAALELTGEGLKRGVEDTGKMFGQTQRLLERGYNDGLTGGREKQAKTPAQQEATRELYDPRRRRQGGGTNFASLTTGQFDTQPSLIG